METERHYRKRRKCSLWCCLLRLSALRHPRINRKRKSSNQLPMSDEEIELYDRREEIKRQVHDCRQKRRRCQTTRITSYLVGCLGTCIRLLYVGLLISSGCRNSIHGRFLDQPSGRTGRIQTTLPHRNVVQQKKRHASTAGAKPTRRRLFRLTIYSLSVGILMTGINSSSSYLYITYHTYLWYMTTPTATTSKGQPPASTSVYPQHYVTTLQNGDKLQHGVRMHYATRPPDHKGIYL